MFMQRKTLSGVMAPMTFRMTKVPIALYAAPARTPIACVPTRPGLPKSAPSALPQAVLIDARCISAGEGWASWFVARKRARFFGEATAGASSRKRQHELKNGLYKVVFPVNAYTGFLDRPIERRGLEPDEPVRQNAVDLAAGRDTVLEAARDYLRAGQEE